MTPDGSSFRLLVLLDQLQPTGLVLQLLELLDRLRQRDVAVKVACVVRRDSDAQPLVDALDRRGISFAVVPESHRFDPGPVLSIRRIVQEWRPDVLETHGYKSAAHALLLQNACQVQWVAFYHGRTTTSWRVRVYHQFERWAMSRADVIATVSKGVEEHLRPRDRQRLMLVPNGVVPLPPARRARAAVRAGLGLREEDRVLGFVGRLSLEKGPDVFLQTVETLQARDPRVRGLVVGDGSMREELEACAGASQGGPTIFVGHVDQVADLYGAMDALVISSRSEVFPNVLLEAVEQRVPVAATPVGGIPWIAEGMESVVVAAESDELSAAVEAVMTCSDAELVRSRKTLRERFSQERRVEHAMEVYHTALAGTDRA